VEEGVAAFDQGDAVIITVKPQIVATAVLTSGYTPGDGQFVVSATAGYGAGPGKLVVGLVQYSYVASDPTHFTGVTVDAQQVDFPHSIGTPAIQKVGNAENIQRQLSTAGFVQTKGADSNVQGGYGLPSYNPKGE